ncbi:unnamed protein product [Gordionus sp. m RMFG-2023]
MESDSTKGFSKDSPYRTSFLHKRKRFNSVFLPNDRKHRSNLNIDDNGGDSFSRQKQKSFKNAIKNFTKKLIDGENRGESSFKNESIGEEPNLDNRLEGWVNLGGSVTFNKNSYDEADKTNRSSQSSECHGEDIIVTPFAQILATLQNIRNNFTMLNKLSKDKSKNASKDSQIPHINSEDFSQNLAIETLNEFDWCLNQLENLQTHRSVSEMASTKFKKMLNEELTQLAQNDKEGNEVTEYLYSNFLDKDQDYIENHQDEAADKKLSPQSLKDSFASLHLNDKIVSGSEKIFGNLNQTRKVTPDNNRILQKYKTSEELLAALDKSWDKLKDKNVDKNNKSHSLNDWDISGANNHNNISYDSSLHTLTRRDSMTGHNSLHMKYDRENSSKTFNVISSIMGFNPICIKIHDFKNGIPKYGIRVDNEELLEEQLQNVDKWGMDIFKLNNVTSHRPLTCLTYTIFKKRNLIDIFKIPVSNLLNFIMCVEDHYLSIPYHNRIHATDVTQSTHILLSSSAFKNIFNDLEIFAIIIASAIHDVDHPGYTNQFLINSCSDLAIIYNDEAVLENHHLAIAFKILQEPKCDIFVNLNTKKKSILRKLIIDLVLATDMSKHMKVLADLKTMVETKKISGSGDLALESYAEKNQILQAMIHCGDLSNPTKSLNLYKKWTSLIMEEYFLQGEKEKQCGLAISAMCDRETASVEKTQIGFMDYIVQPLWETWADLVYPDCQCMLQNLETNREYFENLLFEKEADKIKTLSSTPFHSAEELHSET